MRLDACGGGGGGGGVISWLKHVSVKVPRNNCEVLYKSPSDVLVASLCYSLQIFILLSEENRKLHFKVK